MAQYAIRTSSPPDDDSPPGPHRTPRVVPAVPPDVPTVAWGDLLAEFVQTWGQGEHLTIVGPTGEGKTYLELEVLKARHDMRGSHVVFLESKPKDRTIRALGWPVIRSTREWPPGYGEETVVVWPPYGDVRSHAARQRAVFSPILAEVFRDGGRVVAFDEVADFDEDFRMGAVVAQFLKKGRSNGLTVVSCTQRPRRVPRPVFSECTWFCSFIMTDDEDLKRVAEIGGRVDKAALRSAIRSLGRHEFVLCRTRTGEMVRSKVTR